MRNKEGYRTEDLAWIASYQGKEVESFQEFESIIGGRWYNYSHGNWLASFLLDHAKKKYAANQKAADTIVCLNAATGKKVWRKEFVVTTDTAGPTGIGYSCTPAVAKDKVYFLGVGGVYCLDAKKGGELVWRTKGEPGHSSPLVLNGVVYVAAQELAAFDADTGKELWRQPKIKSNCSSPTKWTYDGKTYLLCTFGSGQYTGAPTSVCCLDPADGKMLWEFGAGVYDVRPTPPTSGDIMVVRGGNGAEGYRISPQKAEKLWTNNTAGDAASSPVIYQDHVYLCTKHYSNVLVHVLDLQTGEKTLSKDGRRSTSASTPAVADGKLFILDLEGGLYGFKATPDRYEEVGYMPRAAAVKCTSPAVAGGRLYLRLKDSVACYDLAEDGPYLAGVSSRSDAVTFRFAQTGGGLLAKGAETGVTVTSAAGPATPAKVKIEGDDIVVDIKDAAAPFEISYPRTGALTGKNELPLPAFGWSAPRALRHWQCLGNTPHTAAAWVKVANPSKGDILFLGLGRHLAWQLTPDTARFGVRGGPEQLVRTKLEAGKWKHVATTFDGKTLTGYLDGEKLGSVAATFGLQGVPLDLARTHQWGDYFEGEVEDLRIYARALSANEVADLGVSPDLPVTPETREAARNGSDQHSSQIIPPILSGGRLYVRTVFGELFCLSVR